MFDEIQKGNKYMRQRKINNNYEILDIENIISPIIIPIIIKIISRTKKRL